MTEAGREVPERRGLGGWLTVTTTILLIWVYSFKGGIKTIVWTDTLQTACMLLSVIFSVWFIAGELDLNIWNIGSAVRDGTTYQWARELASLSDSELESLSLDSSGPACCLLV